MRMDHLCTPVEHQVSRRQFLGGLTACAAAAMGGLPASAFANPPAPAADKKSIVLIWLPGGSSQLEMWDPKPGTPTGGPYRAIPTSVPGIHISELLPHSAKQMHHMALLRSLDTQEGTGDHLNATCTVLSGQRSSQVFDYPHVGAVVSRMRDQGSALPGFVQIRESVHGAGIETNAAYLGSKYNSVTLPGGQPIPDTVRPGEFTQASDDQRQALRRRVNDRFLSRRRSGSAESYIQTYEQGLELMRQRDIFDMSKESAADQQKYSTNEFSKLLLSARRMVEQGIPFVQVNYSNHDTHADHFIYVRQTMGGFDLPFATFMADMAERGLLTKTIVLVMSEFGRTPNINQFCGRDHFPNAWSIALAGGKIAKGAAVGKTSPDGNAVAERPVTAGDLFHTILDAAGLNAHESVKVGGREFTIANPAKAPVKELFT